MAIIESIYGKKKDIKCIGCEIKKSDKGLIHNGKYFEVRQDYEIPIPGFIVIASKRHIIGFADFNKNEKEEFINLLCKFRKLLRDLFKIKYVRYLCREDIIESRINPSHFHIALLPEYAWMKKFQNINEALEYAKKTMKTKENLEKIHDVIKKLGGR